MRPLHMAARSGCTEAIKLLLDAGADIDIKANEMFGSALAIAAYHGNIKSVKYLLERGADVDDASQVLKGLADNRIREKGGKEGLALLQKFEKQKIVVRLPENTPPSIVTKSDIDELPIFANEHKIIGDKDIAIVIGIEKYQNIPKSDYSSGDAKLVRSYFKALGFADRNIEFMTDERATKSSIEKSIEAWIPNRAKKESRVFVYYSGHGSPDPSTGEAYLVPYDGDPNYLAVTGYSLKRLYDNLGKLQVAEVTVVLDSCFSGAGGRSVLAKGARPLVMMTEGYSLSQNIVVLSATQGTQISTSSTEKGHGVFTYYFLKALRDGKKTIAEIYEYIKPLVEDEAKQLNVQQSPSISPDVNKLRGRFGLRK
ncbi:MAG: caspase family protein [Nitrospirae bacterium]|nr:caspase family protein [Nitrospirota bacterium]